MECVLSVTVDKLVIPLPPDEITNTSGSPSIFGSSMLHIPDQNNHCQFHKDCGLYLP